MKASIPLLLAIAGLATAQKLTDALPSCATDCLNQGIKSATTCALDDAKCLCEVDNYRNTYSAATACVLQACGAAKSLDEVLPAAAKFCSEVTGGATAPPVDDSASKTQASEASAKTSAATTEAHSAGQTPAATTGTGSASESVNSSQPSASNEPGAAVSVGPMNAFAMLALGLAAWL